MIKKTILIDVDGTLVDILPIWCDWYQKETGRPANLDILDQNPGTDCIQAIMPAHSDPLSFIRNTPNLYKLLNPPLNVVLAVQKLTESYRVMFITHEMCNVHSRSKKAMLFRNFGFNDLVFCTDRHKLKFGDYLIDDIKGNLFHWEKGGRTGFWVDVRDMSGSWNYILEELVKS